MKVRCTVCQSYVDRDTAIRVGVVSYCSPECRRFRKTQGAPRIRARRVRSRKPPLSPELREEVLQADGYRCRWCGLGTDLHVHHAVYRSQGGQHERHNLLTLCSRHHEKVHSNKKKYQPMVLGVIWLRDVMGVSVTLPMVERGFECPTKS